jgi:peptidyl-prolyl cis-trans isomerase A (cyclophilin A)
VRKLVQTWVLLLFAAAAQHALAADTIEVVIDTSAGSITLELYPRAAPLTVANFLRYVDGEHYDNGHFYRTVRPDNQAQNRILIEVIQGGRGMEEPAAPFDAVAHESTAATGILHLDGTISIARGEPGSATSEFFICINDQPELDFGGQRNPDGQGFAAFGRVLEGMDVVRGIQAMETVTPAGGELEYTSGQMLADPVRIHAIRRKPASDAAVVADQALRAGLDRFWAEVARTVAEGDFEAYKSTYHEDAVLVSASARSSSPITQALDAWQQGFADTRAGKVRAEVEFRFTQRFISAATAHETGIFRYVMEAADGQPAESFAHFEALLVNKDGWKTIMEFQKSPASRQEWDAAE